MTVESYRQLPVISFNLNKTPVFERVLLKIPKCQQIALSKLNEMSKFHPIVNSLIDSSPKLTFTQCRFALETTLALSIIDENIEKISKIASEQERVLEISRLTGLRAEECFSEADTQEGVCRVLGARVAQFIEAFQIDWGCGNTKTFFSEAFAGDPCLNGRLIKLTDYIVESHLLVNRSEVSQKKEYDSLAYKYTELLYECSDDEVSDRKTFTHFLKQLKNYEEEHRSTVESSDFITIYNRAVEFYV